MTSYRFALVAALVPAALVAPFAAQAQQSPFAGHYRATGAAGTLLLKVHADGRVALVAPAQGAVAEWSPSIQRSNVVMGTLDDGQVWSVGLSFGRLMMSIGTQLFDLAPVAPEDFLAAARDAQQHAQQQAASTGGLGGMTLSTASSSSGGYFDGRDYLFCSDGSFRYTKSVSGPGVAGEKKYVGRWQASGAQLHLQYSDGGGATLRLRRVADDVFELDGVRFVAKRARQCR